MIVEERIYTLHNGKVPEFMRLYEQEGRPIQLRILGCNVGWYFVDVGPQNTVVHLWAYRDYADRERRRAELFADPGWLAYLPKVIPLMLVQETRVMRPAPFFADWVKRQLEGG